MFHPRGSRVNKRVHRMSEMSVDDMSFYQGNSIRIHDNDKLPDIDESTGNGHPRSDGVIPRQYRYPRPMSTETTGKKGVQFDFSNRSFRDDLTDHEYVV